MTRAYWRAANMLYPVPAVLVSCQSADGQANIMTAAWAGTICSDPVMVSVAIRPSRFSHDIIAQTGEFVINLTTRKLVRATDWCGVKSGRDVDKFEAMRLTKTQSRKIAAPGIAESPVNLECVVKEILPLGSHDLFIAEVVSTDVDPRYLDDSGKFDLKKANLITYSHGEYFALGERLGSFGFSVRKKKKSKGRRAGKRRAEKHD